MSDEQEQELEPNPKYLTEDGEMLLLLPPREGDQQRGGVDVICLPDQEGKDRGCGFDTRIECAKTPPWDQPLAICPFCGGNMVFKIAGMNFGIAARGAGLHGSAFGRRRKQDFLNRNKKLGKSQWDNVEPPPLTEGATARNYTKGGPHDPDGPMAKKKAKTQHFYGKGSKDSGP